MDTLEIAERFIDEIEFEASRRILTEEERNRLLSIARKADALIFFDGVNRGEIPPLVYAEPLAAE